MITPYVSVVLDASAIRRFQAAKDLAVGELIGEVTDDLAFFGVPVVALAECRSQTDDDSALAMLTLLIAPGRNVLVSPLLADDSFDVGAAAHRLGGDVALAQAVHLARATKAQLATEYGDQVRAVFGDVYGIIDI